MILMWIHFLLSGTFVTSQSLVRPFSVSAQRAGFSKYTHAAHCVGLLSSMCLLLKGSLVSGILLSQSLLTFYQVSRVSVVFF